MDLRTRALLAFAALPALAAWAACDAASPAQADVPDAGQTDVGSVEDEPWSCQGCHTNASLLQEIAAVVDPPVDKPEDTGDG